jgi:hypothetical protein
MEYQEKTTDLSQVASSGFELPTLVVISTDCIGSYKSNYHTIMTTTSNTPSLLGIQGCRSRTIQRNIGHQTQNEDK